MQHNDSDQSISEEEDLNDECSENLVSLGNLEQQKENLQVLSEFDLLKDVQELNSASKATSSSVKKGSSFCHEDEIEYPGFDTGDNSNQNLEVASGCTSNEDINCFHYAASVNVSDEEVISDEDDDDKVNVLASGSIERHEGGGTWAEASRKAAALIYSSEKPGCFKRNYFVKGATGGKVKKKMSSSSTFLYSMEDTSSLPWDKNVSSSLFLVQPADESNTASKEQSNKSIAELLEVHDEKEKLLENAILPIGAVVRHGNIEHSMAEFLDCFQERSGLPISTFKQNRRTKGRSRSIDLKRSIPSLGSRVMDNGIDTEALDSERSSGEEDDHQDLGSTVPAKTMADQFQEILGVESTTDELHRALPGPLGNGLYGKLQCVLQNEKELELLFLQRSHMDASLRGESHFIDVRILSSSLEAKLNVCCSTLVGDEESYQRMNGREMRMSGRTLTIIFSSKTCSDVELEVGNLIRIHSPWKEVQVMGNDEIIILSTFFSLISS